jgi:hypothetical protein
MGRTLFFKYYTFCLTVKSPFPRTAEESGTKEKFNAEKDNGAFWKGLEAARRIRTACR